MYDNHEEKVFYWVWADAYECFVSSSIFFIAELSFYRMDAPETFFASAATPTAWTESNCHDAIMNKTPHYY